MTISSDALPPSYRLGLEIGSLQEAQRRTDTRITEVQSRLTAVETSVQTLTSQISSIKAEPLSTPRPGKRQWLRSKASEYGPGLLQWIGPKLLEWGARFVLPLLGSWWINLPRMLQNAWTYLGSLF